MTENLKIRSANPMDADELLAIRRDAIMAFALEYGRFGTRPSPSVLLSGAHTAPTFL